MQPEFTESDRNHLSGRAAGESATVATSVHVVTQARGLKGPTNDLVERCVPHHTAIVVQNHMGKPYACLVLGESHSNDLQLAFDGVEAFVSIGLRWGHELAAAIENLGNGRSVVALDESCDRHPAILASQFWAGRCESAEQDVRATGQSPGDVRSGYVLRWPILSRVKALRCRRRVRSGSGLVRRRIRGRAA